MGPVTLTVRRMDAADADASRQLGFEAFGVPISPPDGPARLDQPGRRWLGAFTDGRLVAQLADREYDSCFGGVQVPTAGIASVTVAAEHRGQGILTPLFAEMLGQARARGAAISTLFPTAPRIYRRFGYEVVADYVSVSVPTQDLTSVGPVRATARRATAADFDAVRGIYDAWAIEQNGPLTRRGPSFGASAEDFLSSFTGVTVAEDEDGVCGFVSWNRGQGYAEAASIRVADLLARTPEGYRALLAVVGSFASVAATATIDTSGADVARLFLPTLHWSVTGSSPYMLKIIDIPLALSARRYPPGLGAELTFGLEGDFVTENNGSYVLTVADGAAQCARGPAAGRVFTPAGLSLLYAGCQSSANLRAAGQLRGGRIEQDLDWDAAFGGRQQHIRDYF